MAPELAFLKLPVIDTHYLSLLAFPRKPYHRLVKDYKLVRSGTDGEAAPVAAYSLAWFQVAGSNSVLPPWVRHQFPASVRRRPSGHFQP
jgi:hypothetical protein